MTDDRGRWQMAEDGGRRAEGGGPATDAKQRPGFQRSGVRIQREDRAGQTELGKRNIKSTVR
jgi:hypothetical protein